MPHDTNISSPRITEDGNCARVPRMCLDTRAWHRQGHDRFLKYNVCPCSAQRPWAGQRILPGRRSWPCDGTTPRQRGHAGRAAPPRAGSLDAVMSSTMLSMYAHTHWGCGGAGRQGSFLRDFWMSAARFTKDGGDGLRGQLPHFAPPLPARAAARPLALAPRPPVHRRLERFGPCRSNQPADTVYSGPAVPPPSRVTLRTLMRKYSRGEPISMVTAYDYPSAVHVSRWVAGEAIASAGLARASVFYRVLSWELHVARRQQLRRCMQHSIFDSLLDSLATPSVYTL